MRKQLFAATALSVVVLVASACGGKGLVNEAWVKANAKINWSEQQGVVAPIDIHWGGGDATMRAFMAGALMTGIIGSTEGKWISLQPAISLPPFNGNVTHEITANVRHMVEFHKTWEPLKDAGFHGGQSKPAEIVKQLPNFISLGVALVEKTTKKKIGFQPRFVAIAHIDGAAARLPKTYTAKTKAVLYDAGTQQYVSYIEMEDTIPWTGDSKKDKAFVVANMGKIGARLVPSLISGAQPKK